jgi:hypothetical protein
MSVCLSVILSLPPATLHVQGKWQTISKIQRHFNLDRESKISKEEFFAAFETAQTKGLKASAAF